MGKQHCENPSYFALVTWGSRWPYLSTNLCSASISLPLHAGDGRAVPLACTVSQQPCNSPVMEMFLFSWLAHSFATKMGHPSLWPKKVLKGGRLSKAINTPIKNALSGLGYMQRVGPNHKQPAGALLYALLSERGTTFLLFSGPAGHSSWWWDGMVMMYFWEVKTTSEWMVFWVSHPVLLWVKCCYS